MQIYPVSVCVCVSVYLRFSPLFWGFSTLLASLQKKRINKSSPTHHHPQKIYNISQHNNVQKKAE